MIPFILRSDVQHFFDNGRVIHAAFDAGGFGSGEGNFLTAVALDHGALGTPSVDSAHLHVLNLVVRFDALYNLRHKLPFPTNGHEKA